MRINMKVERVKRKLTIKQLADLTEYDPTWVNQIELGHVNAGKRFWKSFQKALNLSEEELEKCKICM